MVERHGTKTLVFGGKPGEQLQYKGMAGNQVLEWADIDSEVKTAQLKNVGILSFVLNCRLTSEAFRIHLLLRICKPSSVPSVRWPPY